MFQLVALVLYVTLAAEFVVRYARDAPVHPAGARGLRPLPRGLRLMLLGLATSTLFILIRCAAQFVTRAQAEAAQDGVPHDRAAGRVDGAHH